MTGAPAADLAIVTGASRGIGFAVARLLADEGRRVVMVARGEQPLLAAAKQLGALAFPVPCDLGRADSVDAIAAHVRERHGIPQIIVNSAGNFRLTHVERTTADEFIDTIAVNLVAPFLLARAFLPDMRAHRLGHIITIGSIADRVAFPENGAYAASKFGLRGLHEVMRTELRGTGVRATLISPAAVDTSLWDTIDPDSRAGFTPRSAMLSPQAVADAVAFAIAQPANVNIDELRLSRS